MNKKPMKSVPVMTSITDNAFATQFILVYSQEQTQWKKNIVTFVWTKNMG